MTLCEAAKLQSECEPSYSNVCNRLQHLRRQEDDNRNNDFEQLCKRENDRMLDSFKMAGLNARLTEGSSQTSERCLTVEIQQEQGTAVTAAERCIEREKDDPSVDHGVAESKQPAILNSPTTATATAATGINHTDTSLAMHSMWLVETSLRLRRELVADFENRKHARLIVQQQKFEEARLRATELLRRRQEEAMNRLFYSKKLWPNVKH